jgi:PAS domain S-box-containing protein
VPSLRGYAIAGLATAVAVAARFALHPWMGDYLPVTTMYPAVAVAAWAGGAGPAVLAMLAGYAAASALFFAPAGRVLPASIGQWVGLASYLLTCAIIIVVVNGLRRTQRRLRGEQAALEQERLARAGIHARADRLLRTQKSVLELVATHEPLTRVLTEIARGIEAQMAGTRCAILLVDGAAARFDGAVGPSVSPEYLDALATHSFEPPYLGPHAMAAHTGQPVAVADIERDERFPPDWREPARRLGARSCEVVPVAVGGRGVVATFAMYRATVGPAPPDDRDLVDVATRLASIAIAHRGAHDELQRREEGLRQLADVMPQIVYISGPDGRVTYLNSRWREYTGLTSDDLPSAVHPDDFAGMTARWQQAQATKSEYHAEFRLRRAADGEFRWFLTRAVPVLDAGAVVRWFGTSTDIHDQKQAAAWALRRSEQMRRQADVALRLAAAQTIEAVFRIVADEARQLVGCQIAVVILRRGDAWADALIVPSLSEPYAAWRGFAAARDGTGLYVEVCRNNRPMRLTQAQFEAHPEWRELSALASSRSPLKGWLAVPLVDEHGANLGLLQVSGCDGEDFSADDQSVLEQLAYMSVTAVERVRLLEGLRESDQRKTAFLATLAHELRNPLAPMVNGLAVIRAAGAAPDTLRAVGAVLERQIGHMVRLIDDLLDVSRISLGQIELRVEPVSLEAVLADAVQTSRPLIDTAGHRLTIALPAAETPLLGDPTRLTQVFANLLNNAAKYTPAAGRIDVACEVRDGVAHVTVSDDGEGIRAELLPVLFEPFSAASGSPSRRHGGLGLGLSIVRGLVEMHGGTIDAASAGPGLGSRFVVRLPVAAADAVAPTGAAAATPATVRTRKVLVVDDNADAATSLAMLLELRGHRVRVAFDGLTGVAVGAEFRPDAIVLDLGMPDVDGYETARRIRREPWGQTAVLIAQTGWGQDADRLRSTASGFDHHLVKPADVTALERLFDRP